MTFNEWFTKLPEGRQKILREDKWMLAEAAFEAGVSFGRSTNKEGRYLVPLSKDGNYVFVDGFGDVELDFERKLQKL